ncbi:DMT family transporter [Pseudoalteromonas sp. JBTF-M23]|uniref:DMT family transporter n=1 Tax=Pseudoalteromonas caenipelagi TaxID=2726988 RepID=A0A849VBC1_9GAMM|nr:DMT family transporter [Pseudoalteromonas caenipelagi]NOU50158.1 DMT family transporter [Pseudoalteromonas caenipelagi]
MLFALLSALCWAGFDFCRKKLAKYYSAPLMSVVFSLSVLPVFFGLWVYEGARLPSDGYYLSASVSGLLAAVASVAFIRALAIGKIAIVLSMLSFTPVCSALLAWLWLAEPLTTVQILGVMGIVGGSFWLMGARFKTPEGGVWLALLTSLCWGCSIVFDKYALQYSDRTFHATYITSIVLCATAVVLRVRVKVEDIQKHICWWSVSALIFSSAVIFQLVAIELMQPGIVEGLKRSIGITSAMLVGACFFKEQLTGKQSAAIILMLLSTLVLLI